MSDPTEEGQSDIGEDEFAVLGDGELIDDALFSETGPGPEIPDPAYQPFDVDHVRERARGWLALGLVGLLFLLTLVPLFAMVLDWAEWPQLEGFFVASYGSVVGLVGSVIGFYYGSVQGGGKR